MPIYSPPNCKWKILVTIIVFCVLVVGAVYLVVPSVGLVGAIFVLVLSLALLVWFMDTFGDQLLSDERYRISKEEINKMSGAKIPNGVIRNFRE